MTMIVALANQRFALVAADMMGVAATDGHADTPTGRVTFKAGDRLAVQKPVISADGRDLIVFAGTMNLHAQWAATFLASHRGFAGDDYLASQMFAEKNRFDSLPSLPPDASDLIECCIHAWEENGRFILTKIEAALNLATRESLRGRDGSTRRFVIGSGNECLAALLGVGELRTEWESLAKKPDLSPDDYAPLLTRLYAGVAGVDNQVSAAFMVFVLRPGGTWALLR